MITHAFGSFTTVSYTVEDNHILHYLCTQFSIWVFGCAILSFSIKCTIRFYLNILAFKPLGCRIVYARVSSACTILHAHVIYILCQHILVIQCAVSFWLGSMWLLCSGTEEVCVLVLYVVFLLFVGLWLCLCAWCVRIGIIQALYHHSTICTWYNWRVDKKVVDSLVLVDPCPSSSICS
jgi:hypothetical protein